MVGDPVGKHGQAEAGHVELRGAVHRTPTGNRRNLCSDKDACRTVAQGMQTPADPLEGLPGTGQQHPDLRVSQRHFLMGQTEETAIEELLPIFTDQSLVGTSEATRTGEAADRPVSPAIAIRHRVPYDLAFAEETPEVIVGEDAAGHAVTVSYDGNRVLWLMHVSLQWTREPGACCLSDNSRLAGNTENADRKTKK